MLILGALAAVATQATLAAVDPIGYKIATPTGFTPVAHGKYNGSLYHVELPSSSSYSSGNVLLVDLHGTRYQQGYDYGMLAGIGAESNYNDLVNALLKTGGLPGFSERFALEALIDNQWSKYLSKAVPEEYMQEIEGFDAGAKVAKTKISGGKLLSRALTLANLPGDVKDIVYVLADEKLSDQDERALEKKMKLPEGMSTAEFVRNLNWPKAQCSMIAVWGSRTEGGELLSGRNLDWNENTGINQYKLVAVWHPPEAGRHPHATFGFAATGHGALTGMSAEGLTMHEANLESNRDSFRGFPWLLRLRYVMEHASDLASATALFEGTNNTVGFNHMIGSAKDRSAVVFETMAGYTAKFSSNDPREAAAAIVDPKNTSFVVKGEPMPEALWRTNHGFDQTTIEHYMWNGTHAYRDSDHRYQLIASQIKSNAISNKAMGVEEIVQVTALVGQKGADYYHCKKPFGGSNVVSVAYDPSKLTVYAAWEDGANDTWVPAACSTYVALDMRKWF